MHFYNVSIGLAFLAGLASFLSPCVFSLVPAYISYLSGRSFSSNRNVEINRWITFSHGLAFIFGFSLVFVLLGVAASALGGILYQLRTWIAKVGGIIVIIFGIHMTGLITVPFLEYDLRAHSIPNRNRGYFASMLMGIFFSAGWSPCVGPILGAILTLALNDGSIAKGFQLLFAYSAGLAIPFLIAAYGIGWVTIVLRRYSQLMRYVQIGMGIILAIMGVMLYFGTFEKLARYGIFIDFGI